MITACSAHGASRCHLQWCRTTKDPKTKDPKTKRRCNVTQATTKTPNTLFPGRPDYVGPTTGLFGLLHHAELYEGSGDVMERVEYVKNAKPRHEVATRLHNMIALPDEFAMKQDAIGDTYSTKCDELYTDYRAKRAPIDVDLDAKRAPIDDDDHTKLGAFYNDYFAKRAPIDADHVAKCAALNADHVVECAAFYAEILAYIRHHIPDCAWDEIHRTLIFPEA